VGPQVRDHQPATLLQGFGLWIPRPVIQRGAVQQDQGSAASGAAGPVPKRRVGPHEVVRVQLAHPFLSDAVGAGAVGAAVSKPPDHPTLADITSEGVGEAAPRRDGDGDGDGDGARRWRPCINSSAGLPMMRRVQPCRDVPRGEGKLTRGDQIRRRRAPVRLRPTRRRVDLDD
jgi:hypothetical protein